MSAAILLIEDERATGWALAQGLIDDGYVVTTVGRAEDGLRCLEHGGFDVVITDVRLPGMDGLELARALARRASSPPVILVTAYGSPDLREEASRARACGVFQKPFRLDDIKAAVRLALDGRPDVDRQAA